MGALLTTAPGSAGIMSLADVLAPLVHLAILCLPIVLIFLFFCLQSFWEALWGSSPEESDPLDSPEPL